jgi:hypothetical protein
MNDKFVYDEKTSVLYSPDGRALKQVNCPKAMHWNQLTRSVSMTLLQVAELI